MQGTRERQGERVYGNRDGRREKGEEREREENYHGKTRKGRE